jgi:hypothetical protein
MAQQSIVRPYQEVVLRSATKDPQNGTRIENIKSKANVSVVQITTSDTSIKNNKSMYVQEVTTNRPNIENIKTKANVTFSPRSRPRPRGKIFTCHSSMDNLRKYWFPEYQIAGKYNRKSVTNLNDILLDWMHGRCSGHTFVEQHFRGKALFVNAESWGNILKDQPTHDHLYQVGGPVTDTDHTLRMYYAASILFSKHPPDLWPRLFDPTRRPTWNGKRSKVIYFVSDCLQHRQQAAAELSSFVPLDTFAKCTVDSATKVDLRTDFPELVINAHPDNWRLYNHYKYCLVMENAAVSGYITEKIVWAFLGGCLPIYWGTQEVLDVFNADAFLFYQPGKTLEEIIYLEQNSTAYQERLSAPILANGNQTIRDYFSLTDAIGGGHLKQRIRSMLGLSAAVRIATNRTPIGSAVTRRKKEY